MGQLNKAPLGVEPAGWNGYLDPNTGTSFVPHLHAGVGYRGVALFGVHLIRALSQDDRATPTTQPDGYIDVLAADARLTLHRYGHFYIAASETASHHARAVSDIIQVMNAPGDRGLSTSTLDRTAGAVEISPRSPRNTICRWAICSAIRAPSRATAPICS